MILVLLHMWKLFRYKDMRKNYFQELKPYTVNEISERLDDSDVARVKKALGNQKYVYIDTKGRYIFSYVGILIIEDYIFKCFPKYIPDVINIDLENKFRKIMRVIKKMDIEPSELFWGINENSERYSFLQLAISLLEDYYSNNLYVSHHEYIEEDGDGEVLWEDTANEIMPFVKNNRFIYNSYFSLDVDVDETDFVQTIQRIVLTECSQKLQEKDILEILDLTAVYISNQELIDLGDPKYIVSQLQKELLVQNVTQKQNVLRLLITYISHVYMDDSISGLYNVSSNSYYGTELYWPIWEQVCQTVFLSYLEKGIRIADLPLANSYINSERYKKDRDLSLLEIVNKPKWIKNVSTCDDIEVLTDSFKPDLISIYRADELTDKDDMSNYTFCILDAKYYYFDIEKYTNSKGEEKTRFTADSNYPGLGDISKQFLYQEVYKEFVLLQGYGTVRNIFLVPTDGDTYQFGRVEFDLVQKMINPKLTDIVVIKLNADKLYDEYLENIRIKNVDEYFDLS